MGIAIALAGNPNSGKTTLFNALTGSNQYVGNWPGVTVEKKEGKLKKHDGVTITDLPGIYSLSPYTLEEVVARDYLVNDRPDAIINIIDGTNLERNLYLTTQLTELGIPVVVAINMMDIVRKNGDKIDTKELSEQLGCEVICISAARNEGVMEAAEAAIQAANTDKAPPMHSFSGPVEHALAHIEEHALSKIDARRHRWYAVKIFERDSKATEALNISEQTMSDIEAHIKEIEKELDDDAESIVTNERYIRVSAIIKSCYIKKNKGGLSISDKIDRIVTNRIFALPIFVLVMFCVYFLSMSPNALGTKCTDWANDGLFGEGWFLFGKGRSAYDEAAEEFAVKSAMAESFAREAERNGLEADFACDLTVEAELIDEETGLVSDVIRVTHSDYMEAKEAEEPVPSDYGLWVRSVPDVVSGWLEVAGASAWLQGLVVDGIIGGVGAVLGFLPQIAVLFILLSCLEACGYMARIAFVMDRLFRKFGLSGRSFIPILVATGCGVPGIMSARTIESERDRKITIMTTTFIPCSAKLPFIALIAGAIFGGSAWVSTSAYFLGIAAIVVSGITLKKTKGLAGEVSPFVMELPAYHWPRLKGVLHSVWDRTSAYVRKAGTLIMLSTIAVWTLSHFGVADGIFRFLEDEEISFSIIACIGKAFSWLFAPLGWGTWQAAVASMTGLVAKENIVATLTILYNAVAGGIGSSFNSITGYSFLAFNLLCAPCFAAMGVIKGEMNSRKWFWIAVGYECGFAYAVAFMVNQIGSFIRLTAIGSGIGVLSVLGFACGLAVLGYFAYLLIRPNKYANDLK